MSGSQPLSQDALRDRAATVAHGVAEICGCASTGEVSLLELVASRMTTRGLTRHHRRVRSNMYVCGPGIDRRLAPPKKILCFRAHAYRHTRTPTHPWEAVAGSKSTFSKDRTWQLDAGPQRSAPPARAPARRLRRSARPSGQVHARRPGRPHA